MSESLGGVCDTTKFGKPRPRFRYRTPQLAALEPIPDDPRGLTEWGLRHVIEVSDVPVTLQILCRCGCKLERFSMSVTPNYVNPPPQHIQDYMAEGGMSWEWQLREWFASAVRDLSVAGDAIFTYLCRGCGATPRLTRKRARAGLFELWCHSLRFGVTARGTITVT